MRVSTLAALAAVCMTISLAQASGPDGAGWYIVRLSDAPAATYRGGIFGLAATDARATGRRRMDLAAPATRAYVGYLGKRQAETLDSARHAIGHELTPRFQYRYAMNGMSVRLTPAEAAAMARLPGVISVQLVRYFKPDTSVGTPASAGDTDPSRAWIDAPGAWQLGTDTEGEGIVVADVDTGINSGNSSFAATGPKDGYVASDLTGLRFGVCLGSTTFHCNNKLIGAYSYTKSAGHDPHSPEDSEGHGSHTASTIAGDFVDAPFQSTTTPISGVAPHASIIAYDVCDPTDLCGEDASVRAVDQAIQDQNTLASAWGPAFKGMVLNFSIGGGEDPYDDPVELAFLNAVEAGIYVSTSAGNGGPANAIGNDPVNFPQYPVEHRGPWVASTAAATHDGIVGNLLQGFAGGDAGTRPTTAMIGVSGTGGLSLKTIVYAGYREYQGRDVKPPPGVEHESQQAYPASLGAAQNAAQCLYPFAPNTFTGKIVVCDRGTVALVDKAYNVKQGGAVGVVIATTSTSSQDMPTQTYVIKATLIDSADRTLLLAWLKASTPHGNTQASISAPAYTTDISQADQLAGFSSRGPTNTSYDDLVKPDLAGPGVSVLAAYGNPKFADGAASGTASVPETYAFLDGTSMASPHDTGSAALLMQLHPAWTPAKVKSALMLTAVTASLTDQCASLDPSKNCVASSDIPSPQVRGSGRIDVEAASRTGLVLDEVGSSYEAAASGRSGDTLTTLNLASLGNDACDGSCSWTRTLTSAFASAGVTYNVSVSGATSGLQVSVTSPGTSFSLAAGATQALTIQADASNVPSGKWAFAQVDITTSDTGDGGITVADMHIPVAVRAFVPSPHMHVTPTELDFNLQPGASSSTSLSISNDGQLSLHWTLEATSGSTCSNAGMKGLSLSPTSGTVMAGRSGVAAAKFDAGSLAAGRYNGRVCVDSDASDHHQQVIPVVVTVKDASSGGGGGGGGSEGLLALAALSLFLRRRR